MVGDALTGFEHGGSGGVGGKRFRVAFSFAGEKRNFVAKVAGLLAERLGKERILYDEFHEAELARARLGRYLPRLYHDESELVVVVVCRNYVSKEWTGLEWDAIFDLIKRRHDGGVMLCRFDRAEPDGLFSDAGYVELDRKLPMEVVALILERLSLDANQALTSRVRWPAAPPRASIPNNLPRLQYFFGREKELQTIAAALAPDARGWGVLIDGPGGIGKTALAIRAAELVAPDRFKRIIFLSSKQRELSADGSRSLGSIVVPGYLELLNAIARELGQTDLTKLPEAERSGGINRALRDNEVLLILDNLETLPEKDRDRLFAFLNRLPNGCSAIVTSRRRADVSATVVRLERLDWTSANALISQLASHHQRFVTATEPERHALYEGTGGSPLLIRWVVGQINLGRCRTIESSLDLLKHTPAGMSALEFMFGDLLDTFSESETKVLTALSFFSSPVTAELIAVVADISETVAQTVLCDLSLRALVVPDTEERYFTLVPMVADFLRPKRPEVFIATSQRLEEYAFTLIVENGYRRFDRFPVLDRAWPLVAAALPIFLAGRNDRLQTVCDALAVFEESSGRLDELLSLEEQAEARAVTAADYRNAGLRAYVAGYAQYLRQEGEKVLACAARAEKHWAEGQHNPRERAAACRLKGMGCEIEKRYADAIIAYSQALALHRSYAPASAQVANALGDLADVELLSDATKDAERDYGEALRLARELSYDEGIAISTGGLAVVASVRADWATAERLAREALGISESIGRPDLIASNSQRIAKALKGQGRGAEGVAFAQRAVDLFNKLHSPLLRYAIEVLQECQA